MAQLEMHELIFLWFQYWQAFGSFSSVLSEPVVYVNGNFAIGLDSIFFQELHIQSVSEYLKLWTLISNSNAKLPTQLHMSQNIW